MLAKVKAALVSDKHSEENKHDLPLVRFLKGRLQNPPCSGIASKARDRLRHSVVVYIGA